MIRNRKAKRGWSLTWAALIALGLLALPLRAVPVGAQTADQLKVGPVSALAIDNVGGGWGWTGPANPQDSGHLIRLKGGVWAEVSRNDAASGQLGTAAAVSKIVLTGDGKSGWATGTGGGPRLWQLKDGAWVDAPLPFGRDIVWSDLTLSADGTEGWLVASDPSLHYLPARLRNGQWVRVDNPSAGEMRFISLSPDGAHGWGVGPGKDKAKNVAVRLDKSGWAGDALDVPHNSVGVTADNLGNGWVVAPPVASALVRLTPKGAQALLPDPNSERPDIYPGLVIQSVAVNGTGRGWATATFEKPANPLLGASPTNQPLLFWLDGDRISEVPLGEVPVTPVGTKPNYMGPIAVSPDGAHAWMAASTGDSKFLKLLALKEGWLHDDPRQAEPLDGAGICFNESQYCLRGIFADFWKTHGGVDSLGFPITPEIWELTGPKGSDPIETVVQYTQRARLEWHGDLKGTPYEVLLGLLGNSLVEPRLNEEPFQPKPPSADPLSQWFELTQHNLRPPFLDYWRNNGGLQTFGYPRSEQFEEKNQADAKTYLVQYFERNRIEHHPENAGTKYEFLLGLLGVEQFKALYGFTP
jgi:hypothetical protein